METKICSRCKQEKDATQFNKKRKALSAYCKNCNIEINKEHYQSNKKAYADKRDLYKADLREKYIEYKKTLSCTDCGFSFKDYPSVCDFHHTEDNKEFDVAEIVRYSWFKFQQEIKKCVPLCANCHRIRHTKLKI